MTEAFLTRSSDPNTDMLAEPVWCMSPHGIPTLVRHKEHVKRLGGPIDGPALSKTTGPSALELAQAEIERLKAELAAAHKPKKES